jgi:uncharacterized membrane protein
VQDKKTTSERLAALSDSVFAVILTIMVLDLKPPVEATLRALIPLWPLMQSYAVSYLFISIIWVNHHHLLRFAHTATPELIWWNFAHLFMVSLVPVTTAWMAATRLAPAPVSVYALVFVLVEIAYIAFEHKAFSQATEKELSSQRRKAARVRSAVALLVFALAAALSLQVPYVGLSFVCCVLLIYLSPRMPDVLSRVTR